MPDSRINQLANQFQTSVADPLARIINGRAGTLPEQCNLLLGVSTSLENLIGELRREALRSQPKVAFDQFKRQVIRLAKAARKSHMVPSSDSLDSLWRQGVTPQEVVDQHCTSAAQRRRHSLTE